MTDVFISYARSTAHEAQRAAEALRAQGYQVWRDDELPAHRAYSDVIEERLRAAKAVVVLWSADAVKSQWVRAEADLAREAGTLVQLNLDGSILPLPFNQIQCAEMAGWSGDIAAAGWRKVVASVAALIGVVVPDASASILSLPIKPSIAVMPLANLSGDPDQDYFSDGMVVEIVEALSRSRSIFVIGSGSSLSFKNKAVTAQDAAHRLGVRYILEGSVRRSGNRVRVGIQLIDAADGTLIWTQRFEDTLDDVFELQDKVALAVAGQIEPTVIEAEIRRVAKRPTDDMGSYDLYLRAMPKFRTLEREGVLEALELLNRAIELDPDFGQALSLAASCHRTIHTYRWSGDAEADRRRCLELTKRALKVAGEDAEVLARAANLLGAWGEDLSASEALADRAIALNPGSSQVWLFSGFIRLRAGKSDLASEHIETAMRLDPMSPFRSVQVGALGQARFQQGRFEDAAPLLREAAQQSDTPLRHALLAACLGHMGKDEEARAAMSRLQSLTTSSPADIGRVFITSQGELQVFLEGIALIGSTAQQ